MLNYDDNGRKLMCGCTKRHPWPFPNQHFAPWHQHNTRIVLGHRRRTPASTSVGYSSSCRLSDGGNTVMNRGRERLVWWRPSTTNWRSWRPTQPHPVVHMGVHGHRAALVGVHPPLSPPIGRRCSPWWLLVDRVKGAVPIFLIKNK